MKFSKPAGIGLASLTLAFVGCEPPKESPEPATHAEGTAAPREVSTQAPPIEPSPVPSLPTPKGGMRDSDGAVPGDNKAARPMEDLPKAENPK